HETVEEIVGRLREQLTSRRKEQRVVLNSPEASVRGNPMRFERPRVARRHVLEVFSRVAVRDLKVGLLREEREVRDRVHLRPGIPGLVEACLRKDVMNLETTARAEKMTRQLDARLPVAGLPDAREHVEKRVEPRALAPSGEVSRTKAQVTAVLSQSLDQMVE